MTAPPHKAINPLLFSVVLSLFTPLLLSACAGLPVSGSVGGQTIDTRVDSEVASYYLANYLAGKHSNPVLDERIDGVYRGADGRLPDRDELKRLSDEFSVDFAALYFADRIDHDPMNRRFRNDYNQIRAHVRETFHEGNVKLPATASHYEVLFVPTYLYKRLTFTGADMAVPRAALQKVGFICNFVETDDDGPIETNADIVIAAIRARAHSGHRLIIVSASKSGPEVALALTKLGPAETAHVAAWINTVGALQGSPVADENLAPELEIIVGKVDPAGRESIMTGPSRRRFDSFRIPEHVLVVNYFGIPVSGSISFLGRRGFFPLRKYGPNDGVVLLSDMIIPRGVTVAELGSDHFLVNENLDVKSVALAITVVRWLEDSDHANSSIPADS